MLAWLWHRPLADGPNRTGASLAGSRCHVSRCLKRGRTTYWCLVLGYSLVLVRLCLLSFVFSLRYYLLGLLFLLSHGGHVDHFTDDLYAGPDTLQAAHDDLFFFRQAGSYFAKSVL